MQEPPYLYDIDDHPPFHYGVLYGLQWALIMFPSAIIAASISEADLGLEGVRVTSFAIRARHVLAATDDGIYFFDALEAEQRMPYAVD